MSREMTFTIRVSAEEREMIAAIAAHFERTESDVARLIFRGKARELGIPVPAIAAPKPRNWNGWPRRKRNDTPA